ncbi:4-hydroxyphenylacetate 3-monooxygenase, oxygenase component [Jeotgalibacillus proteolyticus]|uniref:4-hydroxyphenylacetate 3-monooxygenase, oxygenase component n=1 Tax=Jeotgalibacillus proteolyticus TaxID=2082395 RepID=A0A2S5G7W3_9BACL|nr:4-hydroxyphenylacetate 3-monooxygenase, oxygenase component [Jeotgalibacillus proteolyticus]PPA69033.1 4-hydroxyphenylacetate 3-monooxygenase, oxygenase component [Jeotgalibacillus proteolyticus]
MAAINGSEYIKRIDSLNSEVWIEGEQVRGKISEHPAFKGIMKSQSTLYDLQHKKSLKDIMTFVSPGTGNRIGTSFLLPRTKTDLKQRRLMIQEWAKTNAGMMGRSPDYMNTVLVSLVASIDLLKERENCFPEHILKFYEKAREQDWSFTHTFIDPQVNRSPFHIPNGDGEIIAAKIVDRNQDGIVIKGAKLLATQGGITDEILVYSSAGLIDNAYSYSFSIPSNTKGLRFLCRQPFNHRESSFDSPLGSRFEESDAIVVFDDVLVPWERVFHYDNIEVTDTLSKKGAYTQLALHQVVSRQVIKVEYILGVAQLMVDTINTGGYPHIREKIAEIIVALETMRAFLVASEAGAAVHNGFMLPDLNPLRAAISTFPRLYPRLTEILQLLGASGMVSIPTEKDFSSEIKEDLNLFLQSKTKNAKDRVRLFRLAWDTSMSEFGSRQTLYERYFFGDPIRLASTLYQMYDRDAYVKRVENQFLKE